VSSELAELLAPYRGERGATIPILQKVQEKLGYLSHEAVAEIAKFLGISESEVFGVLTFYAQFRTAPMGRKMVRVCRGTACHVRGVVQVLEAVKRELGIEEGETTPDLEYTLETAACFGSCALAPVMVVGKDVHGRMTPAKVKELLGRHG